QQVLVAAPQAQVGSQKARRRRIDLFPYLLLAPIALLLTGVIVYPLVEAVRLAMTDASLLNLGAAKFVGLRSFYRLLEDHIFIGSIWRTIRWVAAVVVLEISIAVPIALFLHRDFYGRGFVRAAVMLPYITPPA